jgi:hypothetical protein
MGNSRYSRVGPLPTPQVTAEGDDGPLDFEGYNQIPHDGRISNIKKWKSSVKQQLVTQCELRGLLSKARGGIRLTI